MAGGDPSSPKKSDATTQPYRRADKVKGKTVYQKQAEKKYGKGVTALDIVKSKIKKSGGKIMGEETLQEKSQEGGRSNFGKASVRNMRRFGYGGNNAARLGQGEKRGEAIDKRTAEHKASRGVKGSTQKREDKMKPVKWSNKNNEDNRTEEVLHEKETALDRAKRNIGRDPDKKTCWTGYKAKGTKMKGGKSVPNCVKESDIASILARLEKKRISKGGDPEKSPLPSMKKYHADKKKKVEEGVMGMIKRAAGVKAKKTTGRDAGAIAAKIMRDKEQKKYVGFLSANEETLVETPKGDAGKDTPTKQSDRAARSYGSGYGAKYNAPARKTIHKMKRGVKKYKGEKENNDGSTKMTNYIDDRKSHFHRQGKSYAEPSRKKVKEEVAISEKIKYDKKGSSMDYFLGKDPKKTEYYKKNAKKKNESKSSCECKHESFAKFLEEGNATGRMLQKSKTQVTGHISADRGSDEKKNQSKRKGLEKDLKKHKIGHKKGVGEYKYDSGETGREVSYQTSKPDKMSKRRFGKVMRRLGRKHGQESVITKDKDKPAKLHTTEKGSKEKSQTLGKSKAGKHPKGYGETSGTKVRSAKLPKKTNKSSYHYG